MKRTWISLPLATIGLAVAMIGCASTEPPAPVKTGFLSTYRNLEQVAPNSWRFRDPNNRLARYDKFIVHPVQLALPEGAAGWDTTAGDLKAVKDYMRGAIVEALTSGGNEVVEYPAPDVAEILIALTDAYDQGGRVGIAIEAEMIDSVSTVQIGALVESQRGRNLTINSFWRTREAKTIMDGWAQRLRAFVDGAHSG